MLAKFLTVLSAGVFLTGAADAKVYLSAVNSAGQVVIAGDTNVQILPNVTTGTFTVPRADTYVITFSGECAVGSAGKTLFLGVFVDGVARAPTFPQLSFCSSDSTPAVDQWASHSISVPVRLAAGTHRLQIRVRLGTGTTAWLDDFTTIVQD